MLVETEKVQHFKLYILLGRNRKNQKSENFLFPVYLAFSGKMESKLYYYSHTLFCIPMEHKNTIFWHHWLKFFFFFLGGGSCQLHLTIIICFCSVVYVPLGRWLHDDITAICKKKVQISNCKELCKLHDVNNVTRKYFFSS